MDDLAKLLIAFGIGITLTGALLFVIARVFGGGRLLGNVPGDFVFQSGNLTCLVPIGVSIVLSILATIVLNIVLRVLNK